MGTEVVFSTVCRQNASVLSMAEFKNELNQFVKNPATDKSSSAGIDFAGCVEAKPIHSDLLPPRYVN
jgi:hypothetical protein